MEADIEEEHLNVEEVADYCVHQIESYLRDGSEVTGFIFSSNMPVYGRTAKNHVELSTYIPEEGGID